jgi:hypothetical protein
MRIARPSVNRALKWGVLCLVALLARAVFLWAHPSEPEREVRALDDLRAMPTDVVLIGDSVMDFIAGTDRDRLSLAQQVREGLRGCTAVDLSRSAYHPEIFEPVVTFVSRDPATRPRLVVVPLNLRAFGNSWIMHPAYRFEELRRLLVHDNPGYTLAHRALAGFKWYDGVEGSQEEYDRAPAYDGDRVIATLGEMNRRVLSGDSSPDGHRARMNAAFLLRYAQRIGPLDPRVGAVVRLARTLRARGVAALFYVTPVDHETAAAFAGPALRDRIAGNAQVLVDALAKEGVVARDWSLAIGASGFSWRLYPNEHLNEAGRRALAGLIIPAARTELAAQPPCGLPR